ncbi:hypothetical protein [Streptomyces wuyuanensis]|uniref:hypothetical protein n=1 Tax=Streptomyces wuyuanensis TaxID=1196353 RepID=UPI00342D7563
MPISVDASLNLKKGDANRRTTGLERVMAHAPGGPLQSEQRFTDDTRGVYIQWELPAVLRTGKTSATGMAGNLEIPQPGDFPLIPNRWLVVRRSYTSDGKTSDTRHWLIRSDTPAGKMPEGARAEPAGSPTAVLPGPPSDEKRTGGYPVKTPYGVVFPLDNGVVEGEPHKWSDEGKSPLFLTVNSSGLPEFCSYQPYNQNILSFHDWYGDLTETQTRIGVGKLEITVNYLVVGWYSHGGSDLFHLQGGKQHRGKETLEEQNLMSLQEALQECGWKLPGVENVAACGTVYYGTVLGLPWKTDLDPARYVRPGKTGEFSLDGRPPQSKVHLAAGQSSVEACTTVVARSNLLSDAEARLFSAFQSNLLETPASPGVPDHTKEISTLHALQYGEHATAFFSSPGGQRWQLVANSSQKVLDLDSVLATALLEVTKKVIDLNRKQADYEKADRSVRDITTRLKGLWWSLMPYLDDGMDFTPPNLDSEAAKNAVNNLNSALTTESDSRSNLLADIKKSSEEITKNIADEKLEWNLRLAPLPPYQKVGNPVITMQNLLPKRRINELDGYLSDLLSIRSQPVDITNPPVVTSIPNISTVATPPALSCLATISKEFENILAIVIADLASDKSNCREVRGSEGTGLITDTPVNPYQRWWNQPWKPAFLEWRADLYPSLVDGSTKTVGDYYAFDTVDPTGPSHVAGGDIPQYFHRKATEISRPIAQRSVRQLHGFTSIHPLLEDHTRYRLRHAANLAQSLDAQEAYEDLDQRIEQHQWNLTSATLTGVNEASAGRKPDVSLPLRSIDGKHLTYTHPQNNNKDKFATPAPEVVTAPVPHLPLMPPSLKGQPVTSKDNRTASSKADDDASGDKRFPPTRSGQLNLTLLTVHDAFGRELTLLDTKRTGSESVPNSLQVSPPMRVVQLEQTDTRTYTDIDKTTSTINAAALIDLRPRLHQSARLRYDYLVNPTSQNALTEPTPLSEVPDPTIANPVHGWLMVTRTGRRHALMCYDPQGRPLFDLHCLGADSPATARPLPGCRYTNSNPLAADGDFSKDHPTLHSFIAPLLDSDNPQHKGHLAALLSSLELSLPCTAPPPVEGPDTNRLALLIGRPIALATARLRLELDGPPLRPTDSLAGDAPTPSDKYPTNLGSPHLYTDGLLGYYTDLKFTTLHTHHPAPDQQTSYTQEATPDDVQLTPQDPSTDTATHHDIALLLTPHNATHATIDILPTVSLTLPSHTLDHILSTIQPTIPLGPLLAPSPHPDAPALQTFPPAHSTTATWQWTEPTTTPTAPWTTPVPTKSPTPTDQTLAQTSQAHTGYLQLTTTPDPSLSSG